MNTIKTIPQLTDKDYDRFWSKVALTADPNKCWNWTGSHSYGYGKFGIRSSMFQSHRIAYYFITKTDPGQLMVCHSCDNRLCCNPNHHFLGTNRDNIIDSFKKGRQVIRSGDKHHSHIKPECMAKGETGGMSKMTNKKVIELRKKHNSGDYTYVELGRMYNIEPCTARRIVLRHLWKHI